MASNSFNNIVFFTLLLVASSAYQFDVGEWREPTGKEPETYNEWALRNRFHVGDTIVFKYQNDSVLLVSSADYINCITSNPISKFEDGNTIFQFHRPGYFFFISGKPEHCISGERLIVDVIHPHKAASPEFAPSLEPAPAPTEGDGEDSDDSSKPQSSSASKISVLASVVATIVVVYKLMSEHSCSSFR